jgi:hypothetical protein
VPRGIPKSGKRNYVRKKKYALVRNVIKKAAAKQSVAPRKVSRTSAKNIVLDKFTGLEEKVQELTDQLKLVTDKLVLLDALKQLSPIGRILKALTDSNKAQFIDAFRNSFLRNSTSPEEFAETFACTLVSLNMTVEDLTKVIADYVEPKEEPATEATSQVEVDLEGNTHSPLDLL